MTPLGCLLWRDEDASFAVPSYKGACCHCMAIIRISNTLRIFVEAGQLLPHCQPCLATAIQTRPPGEDAVAGIHEAQVGELARAFDLTEAKFRACMSDMGFKFTGGE